MIQSQIRGITIGNIGNSKDSQVFFSKDLVISKDFVYTDFVFEEELKKIDFKDSLYINNNSNVKGNYKQQYYLLTQNNFFKPVFYDDYLKKKDTFFENLEKVIFIKTKFNLKLSNEFLKNKIKINNDDFIFELDKWQIQIKDLKDEKTEIIVYYNFEFLNSNIIHSPFLKEYYSFDEKVFLRFDHTVFWYALKPKLE